MKKIISVFILSLSVSGLYAQNSMKNVKVLGSFNYGGQEITSFQELPNGCIRKTNPHTIGLFTANESLQIEVLESEEMAEVIKPSLNERVFVNKNCNSDNFNYSELQNDGKLLVFRTLEDYEHVITTPDNASQEDIEKKNEEFLQSISKLNYPKFENSPVYNQLVSTGTIDNYPTLILKMLNEDGAIQIGNFVFRLDFIAEKGYSLPLYYKNAEYNKLVAGQNGNSHVTKYPWNAEMLYEANKDPYALGWGCSESNAPTKENTENFVDKIEWNFLLDFSLVDTTLSASINNKKFKGELIAKYRWTPIAWDLYSKVKITERDINGSGSSNGGGISITWTTADVDLVLVYQRRYKVKCKNDTGWSSTLYKQGNGIATGQSYSGVKALHKYQIGANAYAVVGGVWTLLAFGPPDNYVPYTGNSFQVMVSHGY